jgi:hypothetical protein
MSDDYTARMIQWIMEQAAAGQPQAIPEYDVDPEDWVQDQARRENLYQDTLNDSFDFANSAAAGPGAFAPGAFDSTSTYTPVEQGGMQALRAYAARPNTLEGIIAAGILNGSTAAAEIAKLQQAYTEAEANGTLEGSVLAQIPMGPPDDYDGTVRPDWESLGFRMGDIEEAYITEAQGGTSGALFDANTGEFLGGGNRQYVLDENSQPVLVDVETQMSEVAQRFADQGLSQPNEQFTAWDLMDPNQAQYAGQLGGAQDAWLRAMQDWQAETMALPPQDAGKAGLSAQAPGYDKGPHPAAPPTPDAGVGGGGLSDRSAAGRLRAVGDVASNAYDVLSGPFRGAEMAGPQTVVSGTDPYGFPTTSSTGGGGWEGMIESIPADVAQAGLTDLSVGQGVMARLLDSWGAGLAGPFSGNDQPDTPDLGEAGPTHEDYLRYQASLQPYETPLTYDAWRRQQEQAQAPGAPQYNVPGQTAADPNASGPPMPQPGGNQIAGGNAVPGPGGGGAGGTGAPRDVNDLPGPDLQTYPNQQSSTPTVQQMIQILMGTPPAPDWYAQQGGYSPAGPTRQQPTTDQMLSIMGQQAQQPDWYAQQGGYSPAGPTQQPTTDQMLSIMGQQAQPPTPDQTLSIMGQQPSSWWDQVGGDQQVRIGKGTKDTRTNAPTVYDRYPKPKARDTAQSRMAQENANAAWQRTRQAQRAAGIGTGAYGRAAAAAYLLGQQGITPLTTQQAARRAASAGYR